MTQRITMTVRSTPFVKVDVWVNEDGSGENTVRIWNDYGDETLTNRANMKATYEAFVAMTKEKMDAG